jgi:beta-N-acetylhexosaminidase
MDLHNPTCPVLGKRERCFSSDPEKVAEYGQIYIDAHRKDKVLTVLKHFPGHGNSKTDSHLGIADVSRYWNENELIPYQKLIELNKVDAIMTAHIINTQLDESKLPATLSEEIITKKLRNEMGYDGVVITDDMQMGAIRKYFGFKESIRKAIMAGVDILMFSNNIAGANQYSVKNVHSTIKKMVLAGTIPVNRIDESYSRIMKMKQGLQ